MNFYSKLHEYHEGVKVPLINLKMLKTETLNPLFTLFFAKIFVFKFCFVLKAVPADGGRGVRKGGEW